jgi:anti-sigma factor RsiW
MTRSGADGRSEDAALWRRFRATEGQNDNSTKGLADDADPLLLAAYAEGRLDEESAEPVEAWLARHPEALADLAAARSEGLTPEASPALVARLMALVSPTASARVLPFRRPAAPPSHWRIAIGRFAIAASLLVTGLVGFALGSDVYGNLSGATEASSDVFDQPAGIFTRETSEESGT